MAKPICVMYYNPEVLRGKMVNTGLEEMNNFIKDKLPDYHTFAFPSSQSNDGSCDDIRFEVFNAENMEAIPIEQFKEQLLSIYLADTPTTG